MADYTITISNSINVWGGSPTNKWGSAVMGTDVWAFDSRVYLTDVALGLSNGVSVSDRWSTVVDFNVSLSETININAGSDLTGSLVLSDGRYDYVFTGGTNADLRTSASYAETTYTDVTFTAATAASNSWTEN